jgi:hypothetical protein
MHFVGSYCTIFGQPSYFVFGKYLLPWHTNIVLLTSYMAMKDDDIQHWDVNPPTGPSTLLRHVPCVNFSALRGMPTTGLCVPYWHLC